MASQAPYVSFSKGASAPCIRFVLEDRSQLMLQYMHLYSFELSREQSLLVIQCGSGFQLQIEGAKLAALLLLLQNYQISVLQAGKLDEVSIKRIVAIREEQDAI